jgi:hypothetical protein
VGTAGRWLVAAAGAATGCSLLFSPVPSDPLDGGQEQCDVLAEFMIAGVEETFTVPDGCRRLTLEAFGAGGGASGETGGGGGGGSSRVEREDGDLLVAAGGGGGAGGGCGGGGGGGYARSTIDVEPGQVLVVHLGEGGSPACTIFGAAGGAGGSEPGAAPGQAGTFAGGGGGAREDAGGSSMWGGGGGAGWTSSDGGNSTVGGAGGGTGGCGTSAEGGPCLGDGAYHKGGGGGGGQGDLVVVGSAGASNASSPHTTVFGGAAANGGPGSGGSALAGGECAAGGPGMVIIRGDLPGPAYGGPAYLVLSEQAIALEVFADLEAADAFCLVELLARGWRGKDDAARRNLLEPEHVFAFLCLGGSCRELDPRGDHYFAAAGAPSGGGSGFVTGDAGEGPHNLHRWDLNDRFGSAGPYWTGRAAGSALSWPADPDADCADGAAVGNAFRGDERRWHEERRPCSEEYRLLCAVSPRPRRP